jgi:hypothetical protein
MEGKHITVFPLEEIIHTNFIVVKQNVSNMDINCA